VPDPDDGVLHIDVSDDLVRLHGDLDMDTVGELIDHLDAIEGSVVIDLAGVTFLDSSGLQALVNARDTARHRGDVLILRKPSDAVSRVLDLTNMWATLDVQR
jgi:anti-sigma B factor antagonist